MASVRLKTGAVRIFERLYILNNFNRVKKLSYCTENNETDKKLSGFAASFIEQSKIKDDEQKPREPESFATLLRNSKFIDLGDPEGKQVLGTIYHIVGDDMYIDFGWKFPTVCTKPKKNQHLYIPGAKVRLLIKDLELSTRFLGSTTDITLLEADCILLGLAKSYSPSN